MKINIGEMLTYRRAHDSLGEAQFIARYIAPVAHPINDPQGNVQAYALKIGSSRVAFCAHTDSVHNRQNPEPRQRVAFDAQRAEYFVADEKQRDCLGADNAAGCYVLLRMIAADVPGLYVFFRGEERGGIGSSYIAKHCADLFSGIDAAIAFDRRGTGSIITEMMIGKTCSDAFAQSLADGLDLGHALDDTGSFTDTANLAGLVAECTNVSCGYESEHSAHETLDADYLDLLADACVAFFSGDAALVIEREPGDFASSQFAQDFSYDDSFCELESMTDAEITEFVHWSSERDLVAMLKDARARIRAANSWRDFEPAEMEQEQDDAYNLLALSFDT
jgi:hypothetical protein